MGNLHKSPQLVGNPKDQPNDIRFDAIINKYKNYPSINQIRKECSNPKIYSFPEIKGLNLKKATGSDRIPL